MKQLVSNPPLIPLAHWNFVWDQIHWMLGKVLARLIGIGNSLETSYIKH